MTPEQARLFGAAIRERREAAGLSAHEVARQTGINVSTVTRIELGQIPSPAADKISAIGEVIGVPAADLFALAGWVPQDELPTFRPYLRAKYRDLPESALAELDDLFQDIAKQHGTTGPLDHEDEH